MRTASCLALSMAILLSWGGMTPGSDLLRGAASIPMTDREAAATMGGGDWSDFFSGVGCGIGFTLMVSGYISGVGAPAAALLTAGTLASCAKALGL